MKIGLQLYSVRDLADKDIALAMKEVAEMGYDFVEFAGFKGKTASEIKALLDEFKLTVSGTHTGMGLLDDEHLVQTIEDHKTIGCENIIIPSADLDTKEEIDKFVERVNCLIPVLEKEGLKLHYHNHSREWLPNEDGILAEYEILNRTNIGLEIDTFWTFNAGLDPVEILHDMKDRISVIHLKDGLKGGVGRSLGQGEAPVDEVLKAANELGFTIVVESEGLDPTGLQEVKRCIDYLKN